MVNGRTEAEDMERECQRSALRDTFAAAALEGFASQLRYGSVFNLTLTANQCYELADAMLRERDESKPPEPCVWKDGVPVAWYKKTNHDAAPAARASAESVAPQPTAGDRSGNPTSHSGTGNTSDRSKPVKDAVPDRPKPINDDRLAALEELSAMDQELELKHGMEGNPMIKAQRNNESI